MTGYRTYDVAVRGGGLRVGAWWSDGLGAHRPEHPPARVVLAVHGITSSHLAWPLVAQRLTRLPGTLVLAPDLRGRGRSAGLPGPWGMAQHAEDMTAVLEELAPGSQCVVAGHSMGGFVAVALAARRPDLVAALVLVDGGVPLILPDGWSLETAVKVGLGPAAERLSMSFADRSAYRDFWRAHPALAEDWTGAVQDYVDYDLAPEDGPPWHSSCLVEAMSGDHAELFVDGPIEQAWPRVRSAVTFLRAPRGLQNEPGGLYSPQRLDDWRAHYPEVAWRNVDGVNHYTITLGATGADAVSAAIAEQFHPVSP